MTLSRKIVLVIVSTFIALIFIVAVTSDLILLNSYADLEKKVLKNDVSKVINEIEETLFRLDASAKDYSRQFQKSGVEQINSLDVNSFETQRIDFILCYNVRTGKLAAAKAADYYNHRYVELTHDQISALQQSIIFIVDQSGRSEWHGFLRLGGNVAMFALRPFIDGSVIMVGKYLDHTEITRISSLTRFVVDASLMDADKSPADFTKAQSVLASGADFHSAIVDDTHVAGYTRLHDIFGHPVLMLKVTEPRLIYEQGKVSIIYTLLALIVCGAVFCSVMLLFIRGAVLKRLVALGSTVGDISRHGDITERLEIKGEDELEELAGSINTMLESLESAEQSIKDSEERYRALFERAPDSIVIIGVEGDERGRIVAANSAAATQHGYSVEELSSMTIREINTPETKIVADGLMEKISNGEWVTSELWHLRKDGSRFPVEIHAGLIRLGGCNYILGFDRDITARKLAEESDRMYLDQISQLNIELGFKAAELAVANKELESFNYSVSHDLRGPLTRISGYCQLMLDEANSIDSQSRTYLLRIYESCGWLDEMIDAMLKLSRLARAEFVTEEVDLSAIVERELRDLIQSEPDRAIDMVIAPDVMVFGDSQLLKILISNLVNNAWKYSARSERTCIEFGVKHDGLLPVYFIRDKGVGFDMKDADKLFRVFTRLHDAAQFSGSGIGLATVQRVIARHGGRVWAEGETGRGATFFFTLTPDAHGL